MGGVFLNLFSDWCLSSNNAWDDGGRIVLAWNPRVFHVDIILCTNLIMHLRIEEVNKERKFHATVVYAFNKERERRKLWQDLKNLNMLSPWLILWDFNAILEAGDRIGERAHTSPSMEFVQVVQECGLVDVAFTGNRFTWTNFQHGDRRIWSKIDRAMANDSWLEEFTDAEVVFQFVGGLDHTPIMLYLNRKMTKRRGVFRYFKMWKLHPEFFRIVENAWKVENRGT